VADAARDGFWLIALPGTDTLDPELTALSNVGVPVAHEFAAYLQCGGADNYAEALRFLSDHLLTTGFGYEPPRPQPRHGIYHPDIDAAPEQALAAWRARRDPARPAIGLLFYRAHLLAGNTDFVDTVVRRAEAAGLDVLPVYAYSLKEEDEHGLPAPFAPFFRDGRADVDVVLSTMSFAMGGVDPETAALSNWGVEALEKLDVPVVQAVTATSSRAAWEASMRGLTPVDAAMNVAIPEFDGRIISVPISFKETVDGATRYVPDEERIDQLIDLLARLAALRHKPNAEKRLAIVLTNQAARASRIGNAVGLDAPASLIDLLAALKAAGYRVDDVPSTGDELIHALIERCSYDTEILTEAQLAHAAARVPEAQYAGWLADLPAKNQGEISGRWGPPPGEAYVHDGAIALAGLYFGNVFVALQPPRGYGMDPNAIYHLPDLPPPHNYHALYRWLRDADGFGADAIVHLGKHGTLEWLPGKAAGPGPTCYPDAFLGGVPLIYPFIINDPGEGTQAKRRAHAVIVDHMTPPMTSAGAYGDLAELAQLIDEYYQVELLDPAKVPLLQKQIWEVLQRANLGADLDVLLNANQSDHTHEWDATLTEDGTPVSMVEMRGKDFAHLMQEIDGYLCDLAGAQIRDGLHTLGRIPDGEQLIDTLFHLTRLPNLDLPALPDAVALALRIDADALKEAPGRHLTPNPFPEREGELPRAVTTEEDSPSQLLLPDAARSLLEAALGSPLNAAGDVSTAVDELSKQLLRALAARDFDAAAADDICQSLLVSRPTWTIPFSSQERGQGLGDAPAADESALAALRDPTAPLPFGTLPGTPPLSPLAGGKGLGDRGPAAILTAICTRILPDLRQIPNELSRVLDALDGRYIPPGPSGAPTRGMAHVLPTGRNFYGVDPRAIPSVAAWSTGTALADDLLAKHLREEGHYPESVGISIWGTSAMRTHGDDIAEVFALLGVRPRWQPENRRLLGVDVVPLNELGRPRIDVVCRISGFFRDAFPHLVQAIDEAVRAVAALDEPDEQNFVRAHARAVQQRLQTEGNTPADAEERSLLRIFGPKPGSYGAGILPLIDERNWSGVADFAEAYVNWGGYAYTASEYGSDARDAFRDALSGVSVAVKNQDNREHDIFDSDDYLQFHGGMIATIRALTGRAPRKFFGDSADPRHVKVRDLKEETLRVFRTRVVNPKWLDAIRRHGYKGGLEMASTVDYLFGYDATSDVVDGWMYAEVAQQYVLAEEQRDFLRQSNPWALRDIASRLLEAADRGMWEQPDEALLDNLRAAYLEADADLEGATP
jgi:cobaltochelatase CobN